MFLYSPGWLVSCYIALCQSFLLGTLSAGITHGTLCIHLILCVCMCVMFMRGFLCMHKCLWLALGQHSSVVPPLYVLRQGLSLYREQAALGL